MKTLPILFVFLFTGLIIHAQLIHVPSGRSTIQEGINAASNGDTVLVDDGTYYENIIFYGKHIVLASRFLLDGDTSHIVNTIIHGNQQGSTVSFRFGEDTSSVICGFTITGGSGTYYPVDNSMSGGGIILIDAGATIRNNYIEGNTLEGSYLLSGGGISAWPSIYDPKVRIIGNKIRNNSLISDQNYICGGGMDIYCDAEIIDNEISYNSCQSTFTGTNTYPPKGGGLGISKYYDVIDVFISGNHIHHNHLSSVAEISIGAAGGGIFVQYDCKAVIKGNIIEYNALEADNSCYGAGVFLDETDTALRLEDNIIAHNFSTADQTLGGGLNVFYGSARIINNLFHDNMADYGAGIYCLGNIGGLLLQIINNTIVFDTASEKGGGILLNNAYALVFNTILWGNEAPDGDQIFEQGSDLKVHYSDVQGGWNGIGNIDEYPGFVDDDTLFHLMDYSPCIDAGADSLEHNGSWYYCPASDYEGDDRPWLSPYCDPVPDIGADEFKLDCTGIFSITQHSKLNIQNYPNPTDGIVDCQFSIVNFQRVSLRIYDLHGREVMVVLDETLPAGEHVVRYDASWLPAGFYLVRMIAGKEMATGKLVVQ